MRRLPPQPTQTVGGFRLRSQNFACELINFACEAIWFRKAPRKLLKSLRREIVVTAVSCDFKGLRPIFFALLFRRPFSDPPVGLRLKFVSQNSSIARIRFRRRAKNVCTFVQPARSAELTRWAWHASRGAAKHAPRLRSPQRRAAPPPDTRPAASPWARVYAQGSTGSP
jgi:hypothetical protein